MTPTHTDDPSRGLDLTDGEFAAIRAYLLELTGISLGDTKRDLVRSRLGKRIRHHGSVSFAEYLDTVRRDGTGAERQEFINCLTTNKTDFFRESHHFDFVRDTLVPAIRATSRKRVRIWSSACSTGEEPYSLAITLADACPASDGWDVKILATDIDTAVLATAERGVYDATRVAALPREILARGFQRGRGANEGLVAVRPEIRRLVTFRQINLTTGGWPFRSKFDAIFCRNVVIYFDRPTQHRLMERFADHLDPAGYLVLGHSENLHWMSERYAPAGNTIYRPRAGAETAVAQVVKAELANPAEPRQPIPEHSIILGDVKAAKGPAVLKTLLGSCVSACLYDPETGVGGMNHFSLPGVAEEGVSARYGAHAMDLLVTEIMKNGGDRSRLRAKVFGGAKVLNVASERLNVGRRNAEFVLTYLKAEGMQVEGHCLGGTNGLLVRFHPDTGRALAKPLSGPDLSGVVRDEEQYTRDLHARVESPPDDGITLF